MTIEQRIGGCEGLDNIKGSPLKDVADPTGFKSAAKQIKATLGCQ